MEKRISLLPQLLCGYSESIELRICVKPLRKASWRIPILNMRHRIHRYYKEFGGRNIVPSLKEDSYQLKEVGIQLSVAPPGWASQ